MKELSKKELSNVAPASGPTDQNRSESSELTKKIVLSAQWRQVQ